MYVRDSFKAPNLDWLFVIVDFNNVHHSMRDARAMADVTANNEGYNIENSSDSTYRDFIDDGGVDPNHERFRFTFVYKHRK